MNRYTHIVFNPKLDGIQSVINRLGANPIWGLSHIVPLTEYEWVAVFEAWDSEANVSSEFGSIPVIKNLSMVLSANQGKPKHPSG